MASELTAAAAAAIRAQTQTQIDYHYHALMEKNLSLSHLNNGFKEWTMQGKQEHGQQNKQWASLQVQSQVMPSNGTTL